MKDLNKNIKIFFIDLDGTLLDIKKKHSHAISEENLNAIAEARANGKEVIISTGRAGIVAEKYLKDLDYKYAVTGNGSIILHKDKIVKQYKIDLRKSLLLIDLAKKYKLSMKMDDSRVAHGSTSFINRTVAKSMNFTPVYHYNFEMHKQFNKIVMWGKTKNKMRKIAKVIEDTIGGLSVVSSGNGWTLEISHEEATKGKGNAYVAERYFGITKKSEMAHIGDSMNDSTTVGHMRLIAMKNSDKHLKALTKFRGPHYKKGGVAKILKGEYKKLDK